MMRIVDMHNINFEIIKLLKTWNRITDRLYPPSLTVPGLS